MKDLIAMQSSSARQRAKQGAVARGERSGAERSRLHPRWLRDGDRSYACARARARTINADEPEGVWLSEGASLVGAANARKELRMTWNPLNLFRRQSQPVTGADLRRHIAVLQRGREQVRVERDALALGAVTSSLDAERYRELDDVARQLEADIRLLSAALVAAERKEADSARQAEADALQQRIQDYERMAAEPCRPQR